MDLKSWWNGPNQEEQPEQVAQQAISQVVPQVGPTYPQSQYGPSSPTMFLDQEQQQKWSEFVNNKLNELSDPMYRQLSATVAAMGGAMPASTAYMTAFAGLKATNITKDQLLASVQKTADLLKQNGVDFHTEKESQRQQKVLALRDQVNDKQQKMLQLQQEIAQLNQQANESEAKINNSILGYDTYQGQALARVGSDIQSITNFIQ